jgi:hypothetical protein
MGNSLKPYARRYVADLTVTVDYDDSDGVEGWLFDTAYEPQDGISLVSEMTHNFESGGFRMQSGRCEKTSQFKVTVSDGIVEHMRRIYDEAYTKGRLCMEVSGSVTIGMKAPGGELFTWNQPLHIPTTNILDPANDVCGIDRSECQPAMGYVLDMWDGERVGTRGDWVAGDGATINDDASEIVLEGDDYPVAWYVRASEASAKESEAAQEDHQGHQRLRQKRVARGAGGGASEASASKASAKME